MGKNLLGYKGIVPVLIAVAVLVLIQSLSILYQAKWLAEVISALFAGQKLQELYMGLGLFLLAFLVRHLTNLLQQKIAYRFAMKTGSDVRKSLMEKLFLLGPRFAKTQGTGNVVTLVIEGVAQFRTYLELIIPRMVSTAITPWVILAYVAWQDMISGIILLVTMPILIVFMILIGLAAKGKMDRQWKSYRILSNHFVDALRGLETLRYLGLSRTHSKTIERVSDRYRSATMGTLRVAFLSSFALDFFTMLSVACVAVSLGLRLISGEIFLLTGLTVLILAPEYFLPIRMVGADYHATLNGKEAGEAIQAILQKQVAQDKKDDANVTINEWTKESSLMLTSIGMKHESNTNSIQVEEAHMEAKPSLRDISFTIMGKQKIGIIGESGAGKSTLIDVLAGFLVPTSGQMELNGQRVSSLCQPEWQSQTTYIPQHPYIFSSSFYDNVKFYSPLASDEQVEKAIQAAGLGDLFNSLPRKGEERIGNGGRALSGGQEQRVALARAFLSNRPIILLDEPTAHLDIETEYELKETMLSLFEDKLVLLATHRLHWMPDMDLIIVLEQGTIKEIGTHAELLAKQGTYYQMIVMQGEEI
ncbi:thiol reductant ABC exporter subunit CydD [Brevibacillus laterosporus]|uniref:Thiol reductant ABC exporter subunit CydD n=1 Tax=Brevibacillus laterosporus TaxID=1465 RepID=A0AAP3G8M2_BRELA|nr:thiol reductant ABC exporter subunit CydD [Brevibacillus laterosporus]MCR8981543.1 thiol reductant ABC exporter subunit CydD [Brevibacillus laterosporus]MCZ0808698.1 thiol reductant ABC exporter subunit CydD [Brevibacillus laterosporus]MCZ0827160.1 thiol reductant ABC exporter subunit CydD [Brevibacillus laterosporus]MCZ0850868.1 thiol reductant ABC exporter subunit CydD [Brevibacillus laterosporus]